MIIENYIKYVENFLNNYYKILLGNKYEKKMITPLIEKYIDVRYHNNSIYDKGYSFVDKLSKEIKNVAEEMVKQDKKIEDTIKKIFTLFGYILYIDDCSEYTSLNSLIKTIITDTELDDELKEEFKALVTDYVKTRSEFLAAFEDKNFSISEKRYARNVKKVSIKQDCKMPQIYSEWAIEKAYNSGTVLENKQYLLYILLSGKILKNTIELKFLENYLVEFPSSLFEKDKKINKYLKVLDNKMVKPRVHFLFDYETYLKNGDIINSFINKGFNVALVLDDTYDNNLRILDLFSYVFVYEKYEYYDIIINNEDNIRAKIVSL